jgi:putative hydroxymethylpyrimidine transport system ATP-binding protein
MQNHALAPSVTIQDAYLAFKHSIIFKNLHLTLPSGKWTSLLGPSGVGKTTLLRLIAILSSPDTDSHALVTADNNIPLSDQIAYMAQTDLLLPWLTVLDNVLLSARLRGSSSSEQKNLREKARDLLAKTGLQKAENYFPRNLSGGMRQRTALIRTLIENKMVILMDEPFSALDAITRYHLQDLAVELLQNRTVFFITHDPLEALRVSDEIIVMSGQPAKLSTPLRLNSSAPRDLMSPKLNTLQADLYANLTKAHEETL